MRINYYRRGFEGYMGIFGLLIWQDLRGSINIEGVEYWLSCWKRAPGANPKSPALRMSAERKEQQPQAQAPQAQAPQAPPVDNDDIPF